MPDEATGPDGFVDVIEADELWDGEMESFDVGDDEILIVKVDDQIYAYDGICPHQSVSLVEGELEGNVLTCRAHEWQFNVHDGNSINPKGECLKRYDARVSGDGMIQVCVRQPAYQGSPPSE